MTAPKRRTADPDLPDPKRIYRLRAKAPLMVEMAEAAVRAEREAGQRVALRQARRVGRDLGVRDGVDYGPGIRIAKGEVVRDVRPDIDSPAERKPDIRGGRRRDGLLLMWRRKQLTDAQMAAAEAFRDDIAIAAGARLGLPHEMQHVRARRLDFQPGHRQLDAQGRCRGAWKALGPLHQPIVSWVVISWGTIGGYAQCNHMRPARATARMLKALDLLAEYYTAHDDVDRGR